jgi:nucleotide-binding universal stress UspA family protein
MSYKTILVHVDETKRAKDRIKIAANLAITEDAHLVGVAMTGLSKFIYRNARMVEADPNLGMHIEFLRERAKGALATFESIAKTSEVPSHEKRITDDEAVGGICMHATFCDLLVIGQADLDEATPAVSPDFPEDVILNAGRPVLMIPYAGHFETVGKKVLVAWNSDKQVTLAVTDALPMLKRADIVQVAVFNPDPYSGTLGKEPGADIALYLSRHGVNVEVSVHHIEPDTTRKTKLDVGNALLSLANDFSSDLLVMGAYGHSRFRETILGGVTRTILETMTLPVLLSHR